MTTKLKANFLYAQIENDVIMVGFADNEINTQEYVLLQKPLIYDEQDRKLGFDKIHITYNDQLRSVYGGILKCVLKNGVVNISLNASTADTLKTEDEIEITFSANVSNLANLKQHLQKLFSDESEIFVSEV